MYNCSRYHNDIISLGGPCTTKVHGYLVLLVYNFTSEQFWPLQIHPIRSGCALPTQCYALPSEDERRSSGLNCLRHVTSVVGRVLIPVLFEFLPPLYHGYLRVSKTFIPKKKPNLCVSKPYLALCLLLTDFFFQVEKPLTFFTNDFFYQQKSLYNKNH